MWLRALFSLCVMFFFLQMHQQENSDNEVFQIQKNHKVDLIVLVDVSTNRVYIVEQIKSSFRSLLQNLLLRDWNVQLSIYTFCEPKRSHKTGKVKTKAVLERMVVRDDNLMHIVRLIDERLTIPQKRTTLMSPLVYRAGLEMILNKNLRRGADKLCFTLGKVIVHSYIQSTSREDILEGRKCNRYCTF